VTPCEKHEELITDVAETKANTGAILLAIGKLEERFHRFEERLYSLQGSTSSTAGALAAAMKTIGIATAIGGAVFAAIKLAV
jgi:hypothetical protein